MVVSGRPAAVSQRLWGALSPRSAWSILAYGLPSLAVRVERQQETARIVAEYLSQHPRVARVVYPGLPTFPQYELAQRQMRDYRNRFAPGTILFFELAGNSPEERQLLASAFMNHIARHAYTITLAVSLGNVRTLIEHPSSMTHAAIPPEVQESIGIPAGVSGSPSDWRNLKTSSGIWRPPWRPSRNR